MSENLKKKLRIQYAANIYVYFRWHIYICIVYGNHKLINFVSAIMRTLSSLSIPSHLSVQDTNREWSHFCRYTKFLYMKIIQVSRCEHMRLASNFALFRATLLLWIVMSTWWHPHKYPHIKFHSIFPINIWRTFRSDFSNYLNQINKYNLFEWYKMHKSLISALLQPSR